MRNLVETKGNVCWIIYEEDKNLEKGKKLIKQLPELIKPNVTTVVFDLTFIEMLNSTGLGILTAISKKAKEQDLRFIVYANSYVFRILQLVGLSQFLMVADNKDDVLMFVHNKTVTQ